jgi:hypothetical protein
MDAGGDWLCCVAGSPDAALASGAERNYTKSLCAHESRGFKQGWLVMRNLAQRAQQKKGDQRDGDLNAQAGLCY